MIREPQNEMDEGPIQSSRMLLKFGALGWDKRCGGVEVAQERQGMRLSGAGAPRQNINHADTSAEVAQQGTMESLSPAQLVMQKTGLQRQGWMLRSGIAP